MPRLWMVPAGGLCRQHLLGEHHETHVFVGKLKLGHKLDGYISANLFALADLACRHEVLAMELIRRNGFHKSPFPTADQVGILGAYLPPHPKVDVGKAMADLHGRCPECKRRNEGVEL